MTFITYNENEEAWRQSPGLQPMQKPWTRLGQVQEIQRRWREDRAMRWEDTTTEYVNDDSVSVDLTKPHWEYL